MTLAVDLREWETRPLPPVTLSSADVRALERLDRAAQLSVTRDLQGRLIARSTSYVGRIRVGPLRIAIHPKIAVDCLQTLMACALSPRNLALFDPTTAPLESAVFIDLLGWLLVREVDEIVAAGLFGDYDAQEDWLSAPRGRLLVTRLATRGPRASVQLPCRHLPRRHDHPLNRLMLACVSEMRTVVQNPALGFELHARALTLGDHVASTPLTADLLRAAVVRLDRRNRYYEGIVRIAELLLTARTTAHANGPDEAEIIGHLFDMNLLFERFVARLCTDFAPAGLTVQTQETLPSAYTYSANPHGWRVPRLRPDIVVRRANVPVAVIDTKYKSLAGVRPSPEDIYQTTIYAMAFGPRPVPVSIVYPGLHEESTVPGLTFTGLAGGAARARVHMVAICLPRCTAMVRNGDHRALRVLVSNLLKEPALGEATA